MITGILYPVFITIIAQLTMPHQANGSFIVYRDQAAGSRLIGQKFESDKYFWGRPSASNYNPLASGGSNLGPISLKLKNLVMERRAYLLNAEGLSDSTFVPADLLYASASGLDPHITVEAANFQKKRIGKSRNFDEGLMKSLDILIKERTEKRGFGYLGIPCLNVLELNLALDDLSGK